MNAEILSINTSDSVHSNIYSKCNIIRESLSTLGVDVSYASNIENNEHSISECLISASERSSIIFILGAIGSECLAKDILCNLLKLRITKNRLCTEHLQRQLNDLNLENNSNYEKSLYIPENSVVFPDKKSLFASFAIATEKNIFILLPDTNTDISYVIYNHIIKYIADLLELCYSSATLNAFDHSTDDLSNLAEKLSRRNKTNINIKEDNGILKINISAFSRNIKEADCFCENAIGRIKKELKFDLFEIGSRTLSEVTVDLLKKRKLTVSTAESCTGGMLSEMITNVSGASNVLEIGICSYSNRIKSEALNVPNEILKTYGAISKQTAAFMAKGIKDLSDSDIGIGITGVAGPGTSEGKAVGTVFAALYDGSKYYIRVLHLNPLSKRNDIRKYASNTAMDLIRRYCEAYPDNLCGYTDIDELNVLTKQPQLLNTPVSSNYADENKTDNNNIKIYNNTDFVFYGDNQYDGFNVNEEAVEYLNEDSNFNISYEKSLNTEEPDIKKKKIKTNKTKEKKPDINNGKRKIKNTVFYTLLAIIVIIAIIMLVYFNLLQKQNSVNDLLVKIYSDNPLNSYTALSEKNSDYYGWLSNKNGDLYLPVCKTDDNDYYNNHNFLKSKSSEGTLFIDKNCNLDENLLFSNKVIYGKNLKSGNMMTPIIHYEDINYLKSNSTITINVEGNNKLYQIFAILVINANPADDNNYVFPFYKSYFSDDEEFNLFKKELSERSIINSKLSVNRKDSLISLVTNYSAFEGSRFVVLAKEVNSEQNAEYTVNSSPRYPQIWYDKKGIENPFKN